MAHSTSRRRFLKTAPLAAAALPLVEMPLAETMHAEAPATAVPFKLISSKDLAQHEAALKAAPGNYNFFDGTALPVTCVLTVENAKSAKEFEWHEGRDHVFQVLEGETVYEVGGTPEGGHNTKPQEWLAPNSTGATKLMLKKGDVLVIPRNTPHKRSTATSVTFFLFSTTGNMS